MCWQIHIFKWKKKSELFKRYLTWKKIFRVSWFWEPRYRWFSILLSETWQPILPFNVRLPVLAGARIIFYLSCEQYHDDLPLPAHPNWGQERFKAMKSSPLLGPFCGSEFWDFLYWKYKEIVCFYVSNLRQ